METTRIIRVMLCEDDDRVRQTLARAIGSQSDFEVVAAVGTGEEAVALVDDTLDALVLDVHLPGIDGVEVVRLLRARNVQIPIVVLTADDRAAARVRDFVAVSFLSKGTTSALNVLAAIRATVADATS